MTVSVQERLLPELKQLNRMTVTQRNRRGVSPGIVNEVIIGFGPEFLFVFADEAAVVFHEGYYRTYLSPP